jgi:hypothetical protein
LDQDDVRVVLNHHKNPRSISARHHKFSRTFRRGDWKVTGDTAKFASKYPSLKCGFDGLHRFTGYAASEVKEPMVVWAYWETDPEVMAAVDGNQGARGCAVVMKHQDEEKYAAILASASRLVWLWKHEILATSSGGDAPDNQECRRLVEMYPDLRASALAVGPITGHLTLQPGVQAFIHFMMSLEDPRKADQFLVECRDDELVPRDNPARQLSSTMLALRNRLRSYVPQKAAIALATRAANAYMEGRKLGVLRLPAGGMLGQENMPKFSWIEPIHFDIAELEIAPINLKAIMDRARDLGVQLQISKSGKLVIRYARKAPRFSKKLAGSEKEVLRLLREERGLK